MSSDAKLELVHVTKRYGDTTAVDRIDLKIAAGSYCCLLGPSGCGKTSTLRMIAGHEIASEGDIVLGDRNITNLAAAERGTAMMFQSYALFPHLSALDNVAFSLKMRGIAKEARQNKATELLERVSLGPLAHRKPAELSGGQQQRVSIARAIVSDPTLLVCDEPTGDLDRQSAEDVLGLLRVLNREHGKTILMVTHDPKAAGYASQILHLDKGALVEPATAA
jgi:putative spermidine/putrescine transport system ATP-binding protein